ncbi:MAG TPA: hypothetical protein VG826_21745 [Pirellulales bacterium]|nr:hypothetical protein [Pirellulales bacterium]
MHTRIPRYSSISIGLLIAAGIVSSALAADQASPDDRSPPSDDQAPTRRLALYPAAEPKPALRYRLLPSLIDLRPGNAAVFYNKAALMFSQGAKTDELKKVDEWLEMPIQQLPQAEVAAFVDRWQNVIRELTYASLREDCDWQTPIREQMPYTILLPEVQEMRALARLIGLKARLEIAQGKFDDAVRSFGIGYAMAVHVARGPTLIQALVGMAIANMVTSAAMDLCQQPDSPNLHWAFTALPNPLVGLQRANQFEFDMFYFWHPEWRHRAGNTYSAAEWQRGWEALADSMAEFDPSWAGNGGPLRVLGRAVRLYPQAKRWMMEHGRAEDEVERMPVAQVLLVYTLDTYDQLRDERFKWAGLPYREMHRRLHEENESLRRESEEREIVPLAGTLLPAIFNVALAQARSDRNFCLARIIEALRLHAASHQGRLPERLSDIEEVPIPHDPLTGGDFVYRLSGETAVLETPLPEGMSPRQHGLRYEISVAH